jgi:hypothetical protein
MAGLDGRDIRAWLVHREDRVSIDKRERERERERELLFSAFKGWFRCSVGLRWVGVCESSA